jgi:hypothetical protein
MFVASSPLFSQGNAGRILGAVTDQSGGSVAGATVTLIDTQRNLTRTLTTDNAGEYNAPNLLPGTYNVRAAFQGFKTAERAGVTLETSQDLRVDLTLQPGEQTERVTVTEALPMVETTNAELGGTLQSDIVNQLPMNGRNFANLIQLRPGFTIYPGGSGWAQSNNGLRSTDNIYLVDGVNGNDPWMSQAVWDSVMASGDTGTLISMDSIDEFKTEENPRAEYGWKPGGIVNVGIKSGTNSYHGTAFAYGRDGSWDARNFFFSTAPASQIPPLGLEQFGATFGGPIKKDKLFFFLSYEDQRYNLGSVADIKMPITAACSAAPCPASQFDSSVGNGKATDSNLLAACQAALDAGAPGTGIPGALTATSMQLAGITIGAATANANGIAGAHPNGVCTAGSNYPGLFLTNPGSTVAGLSPGFVPNGLINHNRIDSGLAKVNYHLNDKNSIAGMYYISPGGGLFNDSPSTQSESVWETVQYARSMAFAGSWTWTPNPTWVNDLIVGYSHYYQSFLPQDANENPANYSFKGNTYHLYTGQANPIYFGLPAISLSGTGGGSNFANLGASWPKIVGPDGVLQLTDHISVLHGTHSFKFGGEFLNNKSTSNVTANAKGPIVFDGLQDFFAGFPDGPPKVGSSYCVGTNFKKGSCSDGNNGNATILTGDLVRHFTFNGYAAFVQDDWRIRPRVILNLGLRYELDTVPKERDNLQANFDPNAPGNGLVQGTPYKGDHNNFSPRIGIAWDMFGNGKTVLRAGGGILYEMIGLDVFNGIGNSFGLRANPTGATTVACDAAHETAAVLGGSCTAAGGAAVVSPGNGTLNTVNVVFQNTAILKGTSSLNNGESSNGIPYAWANNSANTPLYSFTAVCGDGVTTIPSGPLAGFTPQPCNVMEVDHNLRTPYVAEYSLDIQRAITNNLSLTVGYVGNHGTKMVSALEINQPILQSSFVPGVGQLTFGPGYTAGGLATCASSLGASGCSVSTAAEQAARPYIGKFPFYRFIDEYGNLDSSNYNSLQATLTARNYHGLTLTGGFTYSHALGENSSQGTAGNNVIPIDSTASLRNQIYGPTVWDIRERGTISATYTVPGKKGFGQMLEAWSINAVSILQTGTPWGTSDTTTDFSGTGEQSGNSAANMGGRWNFYGNPKDWNANHNFYDVFPATLGAQACPSGQSSCGIPYYPGITYAACLTQAQSLGPLAVASLTNLGCYKLGSGMLIPAAYGSEGNFPRLPFRGPHFSNLDVSVTKAFRIRERLSAQFRAEFFNALNHPEFVNPQGAVGGNAANLNPTTAQNQMALVSNTPDQAGSNPVLGSGGSRAIQLGLKLIF